MVVFFAGVLATAFLAVDFLGMVILATVFFATDFDFFAAGLLAAVFVAAVLFASFFVAVFALFSTAATTFRVFFTASSTFTMPDVNTAFVRAAALSATASIIRTLKGLSAGEAVVSSVGLGSSVFSVPIVLSLIDAKGYSDFKGIDRYKNAPYFVVEGGLCGAISWVDWPVVGIPPWLIFFTYVFFSRRADEAVGVADAGLAINPNFAPRYATRSSAETSLGHSNKRNPIYCKRCG